MSDIIKGQISIFDLPMQVKPKEEIKITDEDIQRVLMFKHGLGYIEARIKVYNHFVSNNNNCSDKFLKEVYGTCGKINGKDSKGIGYSDTYMENGIEIAKDEIKTFMPWAYIKMKISLLIRDGIFITDEEKLKYGLIKDNTAPNKPKIRLLKDMKDLRQDFLKGNVYEVWQEKPNNYLIYLDGTFYGPLKENCERVN